MAKKPSASRKGAGKKAAPKLKISKGVRRRAPSTVATAPPTPMQSIAQAAPVVTQLPERYDEDTLVVLSRDPRWIFAYWELRDVTVRRAQTASALGRPVLRVYDVTDILFDGRNAHHQFDIEIQLAARNWYVNVPAAGRSYLVEVGFRSSDGRFIPMLRSNAVETPPESVSPRLLDQFITIRTDVPLRRIEPRLLRKVAEGKPLTAEERRRIFAMSAGLRLGLSETELETQWRHKIASHAGASR